MKIAIIGGGINGLCCAWKLSEEGGHEIDVYERDGLMQATSRSSSKLLHGGLRYLENYEFRLIKEALRERDAWLKRAPELSNPLRLVLPIYQNSRRNRLLVGTGLFLYDQLAGKSDLPGRKWLSQFDILHRDPGLSADGLKGGYEFSDAQMDDYQLGLWVAERAKELGVTIFEEHPVHKITIEGQLELENATSKQYDQIVNVTGPWSKSLLDSSRLDSPYELDLVKGSHLVLKKPCAQAYLLEVPGENRIFFVLPWKGHTLLGTTEVRQSLDDTIACSEEEKVYLIKAYRHYFPDEVPEIIEEFSGLRPLIHSADDPGKATREYALHQQGKVLTVFGGKWTTALALAGKVAKFISNKSHSYL
jgi:glycerol-3-phosphate dehydrogenase